MHAKPISPNSAYWRVVLVFDLPLARVLRMSFGRSQIDLLLTFAEAPADRWGRGRGVLC